MRICYKTFKQQHERNDGGWYDTGLVWTENKVPLNNNKSENRNPKTFEAQDQVIRDQLVNNVIEKVSENQSENPKEFFLSHRPVIKQN